MFEYPKQLNIIFDKLKKNSIKPIFVGGFVRDYFLNIKSKDIDIELYGAQNFEQIQDLLKEFGNSNIIGKSFGVIKLDVDDLELDFSLPRLDSKVSAGHKGFEITTFKDLDFKTASQRRDFTINAIGYDIFENKFLDYYNGIKDIKDKKLRFINQNSFKEDPLRVLRAVQFCSRFEFKMDDDLFSTCRDMVKTKELKELPEERVFEEIKKLLLKSSKPSIGLKLLADLNIELFKIDENKLKDIDNFIKFKSANDRTNLIILLALLYNNSKFKIEQLSNSKNLSTNIKNLLHVAQYFQNKTDTILYKIAKDLDFAILALFLKALHVEDKIINNLQEIKPKVHGKDLMLLGIEPSKSYSHILQTKYELQLALCYQSQ